MAFDRHHVPEQPDVQPQVVGQPAQKRHRRMRVGVDEGGHQDRSAAIDGFRRHNGLKYCGPFSDGKDGPAADGNRPVGEGPELRIHGEHVGVEEKQVGFFHARRPPGEWENHLARLYLQKSLLCRPS